MAKDVQIIAASPNERFVHDPNGFLVIYIDQAAEEIVVEHYENVKKDDVKMEAVTGKLNLVVKGMDAEAIGQTLIREGCVSRLDHALYLGMELEKAAVCLKKGIKYLQDE